MEKVTKLVKCDRCEGRGFYAVGVHNGQLRIAQPDGGVCYKCHGTGRMTVTETIRTEAEQAKYEAAKARREAKKQTEREARFEQIQAEHEANLKKLIEEAAERDRLAKIAEEERIANLHRGYIGEIGEKITVKAKALYSASYEAKSFSGFGTVWMTVYAFETADHKLLIWKTSGAGIEFEEGQEYKVTGTVKDHSIYREEHQTILTRAKATRE